MPTQPKLKSTSRFFSKEQVAAARAMPGPPTPPTGIDWKKAIITHGGGAAATVAELRAAIAARKRPPKQSVAIRLDPDVLAAFRADGPGWQTRMNAVLREWVESRPKKTKVRSGVKDA
jgi:BrnA antitoxin of type II toxin-antitoxin system